MIEIQIEEEQTIEESLFEYIKDVGEIDFKSTVSDEKKIKLIKNAITPSSKERQRIRIVSSIMMKQANNVFYPLIEQEKRRNGLLSKKIDELKLKIEEKKEDLKPYTPSKSELSVLGFMRRMGLILGMLGVLYHIIQPNFENIDVQGYIREKVKLTVGKDIPKEPFKALIQNNLDATFQANMRQIYYAVRKVLEYINSIFTYEGQDEAVELENMFRDISKRVYNELGDVVPIDYLRKRMYTVIPQLLLQNDKNAYKDYGHVVLKRMMEKNMPVGVVDGNNMMTDAEIDKTIIALIDQEALMKNFRGLFKSEDVDFDFEGYKKVTQVLDNALSSSVDSEYDNIYREWFYELENFKKIDVIEESNPLLKKDTNLKYLYKILMNGSSFIIPFIEFPIFDLGISIIPDYFFKNFVQQFGLFSGTNNPHQIKNLIKNEQVTNDEKKEKFVTLEEIIEKSELGKTTIDIILPSIVQDKKLLQKTWLDDDNNLLDECVVLIDDAKRVILDVYKTEKNKKLHRKIVQNIN